MSGVIKIDTAAQPPLGIRYWRQEYATRTPRIEVFVFVGHDVSTGLFWFRSRSQGTLIGRAFYQLNSNGFKPFLLNFARIGAYVAGRTNASV